MNKKSDLEKYAGSTIATSITALVAASGGTYLAPLVPVLLNSLANNRYQKRVEEALKDINHRLEQNESAVRDMSDAQFKLTGEIISIAIRTIDQDKLDLLKIAVVRTLDLTDINEHDAEITSRVLRDITVREFRFLYDLSRFTEISVFNPSLENFKKRNGQVVYEPNSQEDQLLHGLVNLGVIKRSHSGFTGNDIFYHLTGLGISIISVCGKTEL